MKKALLIVLFAVCAAFASCTKTEVDDALDRRPHEGVKDAVEDLTDKDK